MEASRVLKKGLFNQRISLKKGLFIFVQNFSQKGFVQFLENIFPFSTTLFKNFSCFRYANGLITFLLSALTLLKIDFRLIVIS